MSAIRPLGPAKTDKSTSGRELLVQAVDERLGLGLRVELVALGDPGAEADLALGALAADVGADLAVEAEVDAVRAVGQLDDRRRALDAEVDPGDVQLAGQLVLGAS